jgi:hypothetical protein
MAKLVPLLKVSAFAGKEGYKATDVAEFEARFWVNAAQLISVEKDENKVAAVIAALGVLRDLVMDPLAPGVPTPAKHWYDVALGSEKPSVTLFEAMHKSWTERFLGPATIDRFSVQLDTMRQEDEEDPQTFYNRMYTHYRLVTKGRAPNADLSLSSHKKELVRRLVGGLQLVYTHGIPSGGEDPDKAVAQAQEIWRRNEVERARDKDEKAKAAAKVAALEMQVAALTASRTGGGSQGGRGDRGQRGARGGGGRGRGAGGLRCKNCGDADHTLAKCPKVVCWACHKVGHMQGECPEKANKADSYAVNYAPAGERRWVSILLTGQNVRTVALVDPGSNASFLRQDVLVALPRDSWQPVALALDEAMTVNGGKMRVLGCVTLEMKLGTMRPRRVELLVVTGMTERALLGADVLQKVGVMGAIDRALRARGAAIYRRREGGPEAEASVAAVATTLSSHIDEEDVERLVTPDLEGRQVGLLKRLLLKYRSVFIKPGFYPPPMKAPPQVVEVTGPPVVTPLRPARSPKVVQAQEIIEERMVRDGIAKYVDGSRYRSEVVMVEKSSADPPFRHVVDYRAVNPDVVDDAWPMPRLEDEQRRLGQKACYVVLDASHSFFQLAMADKSLELTTFRGARGLMQLLRMPQGLKVAPARFNRAVEQEYVSKLPTKVRDILARYVDDFGFGTGTVDGDWDAAVSEAMEVLETLLKTAKEVGLSFKWSENIQLLRREVRFGGIRISGQGRRALDEKIAAVVNMGDITTKRQMRSFIGATGALRWQIPRLDELHAPLMGTVKGVSRSAFVMTPAAGRAVEELKRRVAKALTLAVPDPGRPFVMECDASGEGFGLALFQDGLLTELHSCRATAEERNMAPLDREWCCIQKGLERWAGLLPDAPRVEIKTDHQPLEGLERNRTIPLTGRRSQWMETLRKVKGAAVLYQPAAEMMLTDFFSRSPAFATKEEKKMVQDEDRVVAALSVTAPVKPTKAEWRAKQLEDPWLAKLIQYKEEKTVDTDDVKEMVLVSNEAKGYEMVDGALVKLWTPTKGKAGRFPTIEQIVVPAAERRPLLKAVHEEEALHLGGPDIFARLRAGFYWDGMWADSHKWRERCYTCQEREKIKATWDPLQPTTSAMLDGKRRQAIDLFGPLTDADGSQVHVAVVIDVDDGWPYLLLLKTAQAAEWIEVYIEKVYANEGLMDELLSDRASNLNSTFCDAVYDAWGLDKLTTAAHNPMANGRAEALVKTSKGLVLKAQRQLVEGKQRPLSKVLPQVELALRTHVKSPMGVTPFFARYGREAKLPSYFRQPLVKDQLPPTLEEREVMRRAIVELMDEKAGEMKQRYDMGRQPHDFQVGMNLWLKDNEAGKTEPKKIGPFRLKALKGPLDVEVEEVNGGPKLGRRHPIVNVRQVEKFDVEQWPGQEEVDIVEKILAHRGGPKARSYEVLWSDGSRTWEPSRNLIDYAKGDEDEDKVNAALLRYWDSRPRMKREAH